MNKQFVLFYRDKGVDFCGSDSFCPIDGRYSIERACMCAKLVAKNRQLKDRDCKYFRICTGTILNPQFKTDYICLE